MSKGFLRDTWDWTKWYSKHAWNPWWLIKDHALSDDAFRDYQAETGGDIKWAKRARNVGRGVAAALGAYYAAPVVGGWLGAGGGAGAAGGAAEGGAAAGTGVGAFSPEVLSGVYNSAGSYGGAEAAQAAAASGSSFGWSDGARMLAKVLAQAQQQQQPMGYGQIPPGLGDQRFSQTAGFGNQPPYG